MSNQANPLPTIVRCSKCKSDGIVRRTDSGLCCFVRCSSEACLNKGPTQCFVHEAIGTWNSQEGKR